MTTSVGLTRELYESGRHVELLEHHRRVDVESLPSLEHRLLVALALLYSGHLERARRIATAIESSRPAARERSRCELIHGLAEKRLGTFDAAVRHLQAAVRLGEEASDQEATAWAQLHLLRILADGQPRDVVVALLPRIRQTVTRCGNPHVTAFLHDTVAAIEGQLGRMSEARRHIEIALAILERHPNAWLCQLVHLNRACIAHLECDFKAAAAFVASSRKLSAITGHAYTNLVLDSNEAHLDLLTGHFRRAHKKLNGLKCSAAPLARFAALDALARLYVCLNRLDQAEDVLNEIEKNKSESHVRWAFPTRWSTISRAKWLLRNSRFSTAVDFVDRELAHLASLEDAPLCSQLLLLKGEALAGAHHDRAAVACVLDAISLNVLGTGELQGEFHEIGGRILAHLREPAATVLRGRANRIWSKQGNVLAQTEATSHGKPPIEIASFSSRLHPADMLADDMSADRGAPTFSTVNRLASLFDLASDADLVCAELNAILAEAGSDARATTQRREWVNIGKERAVAFPPGQVELRIVPGPLGTARDDLLVCDLLRIARSAVLLEQRNRAERLRAAVWPSEDAVLDEGSLFSSSEMLALAATARKVAPTTVPVLITGETGTGKEILARAVHAASTRAKAAFLPFNCSAGPRDMIDAQLFGHRRGAFTGAVEHAPGIVRGAAGGTLFLDEIGEAPLEVQPKLLRFLESGEIHPVGEPHPIKVDVRVIAATNIDLDAAVSSGRFREDLFYRLNIVRLHLPPLRERRVEVPIFAQHYLRRHARELGKGDLRLAEETMEYLLLYKWPGNVRQLANEMRKLAALAETDAVLMPEHLSPEIVASRRTVPASERTLDSNEVVVRIDQPLAAATEHLERVMLPYALKQCDGKVEEAARMLGLSRKGLYLKRLRLGLDVAGPQAKSA